MGVREMELKVCGETRPIQMMRGHDSGRPLIA